MEKALSESDLIAGKFHGCNTFVGRKGEDVGADFVGERTASCGEACERHAERCLAFERRDGWCLWSFSLGTEAAHVAVGILLEEDVVDLSTEL